MVVETVALVLAVRAAVLEDTRVMGVLVVAAPVDVVLTALAAVLAVAGLPPVAVGYLGPMAAVLVF
jgi:hypothetical protein